MTDPQALDLETAAALRTAIFALPYAEEPEDVDGIIAAARARGVTAEYCDSLRKAWDDWRQRTVHVIGGEVA